jgi:hypothetical protein
VYIYIHIYIYTYMLVMLDSLMAGSKLMTVLICVRVITHWLILWCLDAHHSETGAHLRPAHHGGVCYGFIVCILRLIPMYRIDILYSVHISIPPRSMFILWFAYQQIQSLIICILLHITCILIYIYYIYVYILYTHNCYYMVDRSQYIVLFNHRYCWPDLATCPGIFNVILAAPRLQ